MAKLIGNYSLPGQDNRPEEEKDESQEAQTLSEFERRAMARLGGSIAFVMKGKNAVWNGGKPS
jgi:hypothetical protein